MMKYDTCLKSNKTTRRRNIVTIITYEIKIKKYFTIDSLKTIRFNRYVISTLQ